MKVLNLRCANGHTFEGWFASDDDFMTQNGSGRIECPLCEDRIVTRMPSAPRLNLQRARADEPKPAAATPVANAGAGALAVKPAEPDLQALWLRAVAHVLRHTDDVGERFAEEARRIHYGEAKARGIRGQASLSERAALREEGIETLALPLPAALKGPLQ